MSFESLQAGLSVDFESFLFGFWDIVPVPSGFWTYCTGFVHPALSFELKVFTFSLAVLTTKWGRLGVFKRRSTTAANKC